MPEKSQKANKSKENRKVLIGVSGCIAAYKIPDLIRLLIKDNLDVRVILTESAKQFVTKITLQTVSQHKVYDDVFQPIDDWFPVHIDLADWADLFVVAPASANVLAKGAVGLGDDLLTSTLLAFSGSVLWVPSMNDKMYAHEIVQENLTKLSQIERYKFMHPEKGFLACLSNGYGRLPDIKLICEEIKTLLDL